jgi:flavin-dependent thymidylate synthase
MKILLAGYNLDTEVIEDLKKNSPKREDITPETLSASYARISRDPRPIDELRAAARGEVEKARKSNRSIIFGMGHHSVAEHAVFNFDIIGVSRLAIEEIERFRLCSFTEKSQRYIKLENDFVLPEEIKGTSFEEPFVDVINAQNELYHRLFEKIKGFVFKKHSKLAEDPKNHRMIEGWAKEDARYIVALATEGQLGQTINARNLELLFRRFASHEFAEVRELGSKMFALVEKIAPSIILFTKANDYDKKTYKALEETASSILRFERDKAKKIKGQKYDVKLEAFTPHPDDVTASALLHSSTKLPFADCSRTANRMKQKDKTAIIKTSMKHMELYDRAPREFEYVNLTYNLAVSSACFGQLKRHRLASIVSQKYDPELGVTIPQSVREVKMDKEFMSTVDRTNEVFGKISKKMPSVAQYVLTNSHKKRVLIGTNARELYHISRLREDMSAQWDIRNVAGKMTKLAKEVMPLTMMLVGGKDKYPTIYKKVYGRSPKVIQAELPK